MNDIYSKKETIWNKRLKECLSNHNLTQSSFADALNQKYYQSFSQKDVSRWTNIGSANRNQKIGFPKFQTMILIADFFNVDIAYLVGETDYSTFSLKEVSKYIGLDPLSIKKIRKFTTSNLNNSNSLMVKDRSNALSKFLAANNIDTFYYNLYDLYLVSIDPERAPKRIFDNDDDTINYLRNLEYEKKIYKYELTESLILLINEVF